jgi:uncharacterized protein DUF1016
VDGPRRRQDTEIYRHYAPDPTHGAALVERAFGNGGAQGTIASDHTLGSLIPDLPSTPSTGTPESASPSYEEFLEDIKGRIRSAQARAARAINAELIDVYWQIGYEILRRQTAEGNRRGRGGPKIVERLSADLRSAFPGARGFSVRSLRYMRAFAAAWPEREMLQSDIAALPWAHVTLLLDKLPDRPTRGWYAARASSWSKTELEHHIPSRLHERQAAAITNLERALPDGDAETVQRITRDHVVLDFVRLAEDARERDLEAALLAQVMGMSHQRVSQIVLR